MSTLCSDVCALHCSIYCFFNSNIYISKCLVFFMLNSCSCSCPSLLQLLLWVRAVVQCPILQETNRGQRSCFECCRLLFFIIFLPFKLVFIFQAGAVWVILRLDAVYIHAHVGQWGIQDSLFFAFTASLPLHAPVLEPDFNLMENKVNNESVECLHLCGIQRRDVRGGWSR